MFKRDGAVFVVALLTLIPIAATAASVPGELNAIVPSVAATSTPASATSSVDALQSLVATLEAELNALVAAKPSPTTSPANQTSLTFTRLLSLGATGTDVSTLQERLRNAGFYTYPTITGYFGTLTQAAVAAYQTAHGLEAVGYVGPLTRGLLNASPIEASSPSRAATPPTTQGSPAASSTTASTASSSQSSIPLSLPTVSLTFGGGGEGGGGGGAASASPSPTVRTSPPVISAISSGTPTTISATITWTTDEAATSQVNYGIATSYSTTTSSAALTTSHSITLTGLTPANLYHFQVQSADGQGNLATSSDQTLTTPADAGTLFQRAYNVLTIPASATYYSFPARVRPNESQRTQLIIRNLGTTTLEFAYRYSGTNAQFAPDSSYSITLNPGQEYAENGSSTRMIFVRPHTSGQGGRYSVYVELNGTTQSGITAIRNITPVPVGVPVLNVISYTSSTAQPIGLSKDRSTVYGANGTTLYQSTNDGASWTSVATFADPVVGLIETDDGEAICITENGSSAPGKLYTSTGWSSSHTSATWSLKLTSASAGYFRNIWDAGNYDAFGSNSINGTGKYGFTAEYGPLLTSGLDPTYPTHAYFTSDYGATWTQVLDIQTFPPSTYPMHIKAAAYDPYWDRLWVTFDLLTDQTHASILYSDDHGATWNQLTLPSEWQGISSGNFQSNPIGIFKDRIIFGSDHTDGYYVLPRVGYRVAGTAYISAITAGHTGAQQTNMAMYQNSPTSQLLTSIQGISGDSIVPSVIFADAVDDGKTLTEMWRDESLVGSSGSGIADVYGPTINGVLLANFTGGAKVLRGSIVQGTQGQYDQTVSLTGDGSTKAFNFPHFLSVTPTTLLAYPQNAAAVAASVPTLTADGTNITLTFGTAPTNGAALSYALRYQ